MSSTTKTTSSGERRHPSPSCPTTAPATAEKTSKHCSQATIHSCATSAHGSNHPKPTASSSGSSRHSNTSTCSAATSATATLSTWKPTASASSTTPSDPTNHSTTAHPKPPTSPTNPIKACQLLDSRHARPTSIGAREQNAQK